jgi:hypothetical protein
MLGYIPAAQTDQHSCLPPSLAINQHASMPQLGVPACLHARVHASTGMPSIRGCTRGCWPCGHSPYCSCHMKRTVAVLKAIKVRVTKSNREMHQVDNCGSRELWSIEAMIETMLEVLIMTVTLTLAVAWRSERLLS